MSWNYWLRLRLRPRLYRWWKRHGYLSYRRHEATIRERIKDLERRHCASLEEVRAATDGVMTQACKVGLHWTPGRHILQAVVAIDGMMLVGLGEREHEMVAELVARQVRHRLARMEVIPIEQPGQLRCWQQAPPEFLR